MRTVKQIELMLKNEPGSLAKISDLLHANGAHLLAFHIAPENEKGRLFFVSNDPDNAMNILRTSGYQVKVKQVIAFEVPQHPGGLNAALKPLQAAGINVDYIYPCMGTGDATVLILDASPVKDTLKTLKDNWIRVLGQELYYI